VSRSKSFILLGFAFLAFGISFLVVGLATHLLVFSALGPSLMGVGVVFLAMSKMGPKPGPASGGPARSKQ
jgi:hypothetical protein